MSARFGIDDVNGCVIGEITPVRGSLTYGGREQCQAVFGKTERQVKDMLVAKMEELKKKYSGVCYDTGEKWEIHYAQI